MIEVIYETYCTFTGLLLRNSRQDQISDEIWSFFVIVTRRILGVLARKSIWRLLNRVVFNTYLVSV